MKDLTLLSFSELEKLYQVYSEFITSERAELFDRLVTFRTTHLTVVLEDIYQSHNASAVIRTCDCFGIQNLHVIENRNAYHVNPDVAVGSSKWVTLHRYGRKQNNTLDCYNHLKRQGYKIIATLPHEKDVLLDQLDISQKTALIFGTEKSGLSDTAIQQADGFVKIPMYGFTESFNISVSAALAVFHLSEKMRQGKIKWQLSETEQLRTKIQWIRNTVKHPELLEQEILKRLNNK